MLKIDENYEVLGWEHAIRGMRNPMNSWKKSDSVWSNGFVSKEHFTVQYEVDDYEFQVGPYDAALMMNLRNSGTDHRKFMRMITVYVDITAPLYWWKEFDTYKVGTVANSCSTMHKIHSKEFTIEDFSTDHLSYRSISILGDTVDLLNSYRQSFVAYKDGDTYVEHDGRIMSKKDLWWQMIQLLPSSYNQKRTVMLNYEVLANIYKSRRNHKLDEWHVLCDWIEMLPYSELITGKEEKEK